MRKPMITRTVKTKIATCVVANKATMALDVATAPVPNGVDVEKFCKKHFNNELVFVSIKEVAEIEQKYAMPIEQFMELAVPVDNDEVEE